MKNSSKELKKTPRELDEENPLPEFDFEKESGRFTVTAPSVEASKNSLCAAFGTPNRNVQDGSISTLTSIISPKGEWSKQAFDYAISFVADMKPRDSVESTLAIQMYTVHKELANTSIQLARADTLEKYELYSKAHARLARTFTNQMEALRKYRNGGEQKVTVQHVNVNDNAQAVIGDVKTGGGKNKNG